MRFTRKFGVTIIPRNVFYYPVGRGDPTPPGNLAATAKRQGGVKTPPYELSEDKQLSTERPFSVGL